MDNFRLGLYASHFKELKIKNATIIMPDDSIDLEADKRILIEFFLQSGIRKVQVNFQCFLLSYDNKKYISISKTARVIVVQYIAYNKPIVKKYYDKNYNDTEKIMMDIKSIHNDYTYSIIPVYINNINNDMERFKDIGKLISIHDLVTNIMSNKTNN